MSDLTKPFEPARIKTWHAHVYYRNDAERAIAERLREAVGSLFEVTLGRWRDEAVGPHPLPMFQIAFDRALLAQLLPWLMSERGPLNILVHARTHSSDYVDHTAGALWLGESLALNLDFFSEDNPSA